MFLFYPSLKFSAVMRLNLLGAKHVNQMLKPLSVYRLHRSKLANLYGLAKHGTMLFPFFMQDQP